MLKYIVTILHNDPFILLPDNPSVFGLEAKNKKVAWKMMVEKYGPIIKNPTAVDNMMFPYCIQEMFIKRYGEYLSEVAKPRKTVQLIQFGIQLRSYCEARGILPKDITKEEVMHIAKDANAFNIVAFEYMKEWCGWCSE
jgi:hypothetical protein